MKQVTALHLMACPVDTGLTTDVAGQVGHIYNDGSVLVPATGAIYAPEIGDDELWDMRLEFDRKHGITVGQRLMLPVIVMNQGALSDRAGGSYA